MGRTLLDWGIPLGIFVRGSQFADITLRYSSGGGQPPAVSRQSFDLRVCLWSRPYGVGRMADIALEYSSRDICSRVTVRGFYP